MITLYIVRVLFGRARYWELSLRLNGKMFPAWKIKQIESLFNKNSESTNTFWCPTPKYTFKSLLRVVWYKGFKLLRMQRVRWINSVPTKAQQRSNVNSENFRASERKVLQKRRIFPAVDFCELTYNRFRGLRWRAKACTEGRATVITGCPDEKKNLKPAIATRAFNRQAPESSANSF